MDGMALLGSGPAWTPVLIQIPGVGQGQWSANTLVDSSVPMHRRLDTQERGQLQRGLLPTSCPSVALSITKRFMLFNWCCYSLSYFVIF